MRSLALPINRLRDTFQDTSNTLPEPRVPVVAVVSTSVPQCEAPGSLPVHLHPPLRLASSPPARAPVPALAAPVGSIAAPLPRYVASYNHFESWDLGFTGMELESEAQLLNGLPLPIRRHQAQSYTFGTGIVGAHSQIDVGRGSSTQFNISSEQRLYTQSTPLSAISVQPHWYHQRKPAPAPLSLESFTLVDIPHSRYIHLGAQQQIQRAMRQMR